MADRHYTAKRFGRAFFATAAALALTLACAPGCKKENEYQAPPPPEVVVQKPQKKDVTVFMEFTGNTQAKEQVEVRARVQGFLRSMHFKPGDVVKKGDLLFVIEPETYQAKLDQALGVLAQRKAELQLAEATLERKEGAYRERAVSEVDVIEARAQKAEAQAAIQSAKADVEQARINLDYTTIHAPIQGRCSRNLVDIGNLVGSGANTLLATIYFDDQVYVYFNISEQDLLYYYRRFREGKVERDENNRGVIYLALADEKDYPHKGWLDYADPSLDPSTGTMQARAVFSNKSLMLIPGLFVKLRLPAETMKGALCIPASAIGSDQGSAFILVVDANHTVQYRKITQGPLDGQLRVISDGLKDGEMVITEGIQYVRPGMKVTPVSPEQKRAQEKAQAQKDQAAKEQADGPKDKDKAKESSGGDSGDKASASGDQEKTSGQSGK